MTLLLQNQHLELHPSSQYPIPPTVSLKECHILYIPAAFQRSLTAYVRVLPCNPCDSFGGHCGTEAGFSPNTSVWPC